MSSYDALAGSYDALMADAAHRRRADFLERLFRKNRHPVHTVLDLACGTGTIACLLAERGYQVTATDGSEEMLTQAMTKAAALPGQPPLFLHQTMPRLRLLEPVDAAISTLDSLNYLTREKDLRETFGRVYRCLKPGGCFFFDVNTPHKLRRMDGEVYMDETEESLCVWRTFFSEKTQVCTYQVDLFHARADGAWDRRFEEHRERAWQAEELQTFLEEAGFEKVTITGDLTQRPPKEQEDRWIVAAIRPAADKGA
ncbi:class I SAM-dependent methyltransferase [Oscillibacter sp.]|uniref:class I SAM-dependent DNA methyltransferase n=1 Tax=Oscillibacter sp. TaxID=1945593 RepID=UPI002623432F|nr:class I SAM-dependent methyltransferase [Oscillibacter sp.]MDD3346684.1 class I SAM-dependent methyltransferase [Oscillibacter sp.]